MLPLSLPGVFAGTLLTFIPAVGDFINAELLGNPNTRMIGTRSASCSSTESDYPTAAALSFVFMAIITIAVLIYAKVLGTDELSTSRAVALGRTEAPAGASTRSSRLVSALRCRSS